MVDKEQPNPWYFGFEEYEKVTEPHKSEKSFAWTTAIGLQAVDGLTPSEYLLHTAKRNIEGEISIQEANDIIERYYETENDRKDDKKTNTEEADKVSVRIAQILNDKSFSFKPTALLNIHQKLFTGVYQLAGVIRTYNFTKKEWVLDNDSVYYTDFTEIKTALDYDFEKEKGFNYSTLTQETVIEHFAHFISGIWQIHPFVEGNTRTTAVFAIKYLRFLGYNVNNNPFTANSWFFRNALVRANYSSNTNDISSDYSFLILFLRNVILNERNELKNRYIHIYWKSKSSDKVAISSDKVAINFNLLTLNEQKIVDFLQKNKTITSSQAQTLTNLSPAGTRKIFSKLTANKILQAFGNAKGRYYTLTRLLENIE